MDCLHAYGQARISAAGKAQEEDKQVLGGTVLREGLPLRSVLDREIGVRSGIRCPRGA